MTEKNDMQVAGLASDLNRELGLLTNAETHLLRQWFNAVQDLNPSYLESDDYCLVDKIIKSLGLRVPNSISEIIKKTRYTPKL
jgi:hypothetical protein